ncbi:Branched-chain amino acid transport protein [Marininema mesophilum]|uniref:Branched-chain amino acid transport protein n=1 Tax=Marininema mesophilum TaxID=1048340 RepID=A0A1H3C5X9_9BACL|nr:AzlD domain-containing protein [Marininema mesophilum]SDX49582.1 Branched-chain amino acid transport protein [Marininema mesophilum]
MTQQLIFLILGISLVTMIPRWIPVWIVDRFTPSSWVKDWLDNVPYAALGAMIFPGILSVQKGQPFIGLIGGIVAVGIAYFRLHILFVIPGAILTVLLLKNFL